MDELRLSLKQTLATVFAFYIKIHTCHWNVVGRDFYEYHKMFEEIYQDVYASIDPLAENLRKIDELVPGGLPEFDQLSVVKSSKPGTPINSVVEELLTDSGKVVEKLNQSFRAAQKQNLQGLMNFLADRIDMHMKWSWFLRSAQERTK